MEKLRIGISSCLLGEKVRYDGGHKRNRFLTDTLSSFVDYIPVCPEVECGLPTPREAMRLVGDPRSPRLVTVRTRQDLTDRMLSWSRRRVRELEDEGLDGFIFKSRSPSSGMERVKVYDKKNIPYNKGTGIFARELMHHFPLLPVEEEGRLNDPKIRESFIERIFVCQRFKKELLPRVSRGRLVDFHTRHKLLILSHSPKHYRELGRLVARAKEMPTSEVVARYQELLMTALKLQATPAKHANVLQHVMGYFKKQLSADEKQELLEEIESFKRGDLPLIVPVTLAGHYVRKYRQPYLEEQVYLRPHPLELRLRNHA